jgi:membrane fusion protein
VPSQHLLFRQEAIDFQQHNRQWGQVALLQSLSTTIIAWFIVAAVAIIVIFLFLAQYSRKETVIGYLMPTAGTAKIFASQQGTIREIYVKEGQEVEEGQPLLAVETSQIAANGQDVNISILSTLESHRNRLTYQIAAEQERTKSEQARLTALIGGLEAGISERTNSSFRRAGLIRGWAESSGLNVRAGIQAAGTGGS